MNQKTILDNYTEFILETGKRPNTVHHFCKKLEISEMNFYEHYASFDAIENSVFSDLFNATLELLHKSEHYETYDAKTKLLSFYFSFFEQLTANRSLILHLLGEHKLNLHKVSKLKHFKKLFVDYVHTLNIEQKNIPVEVITKIQQKGLGELAWGQLLVTLAFWMKDTSSMFEKTDVFIEKSVHASFELIELSPFEKLVDLGKFIWKEKASSK